MGWLIAIVILLLLLYSARFRKFAAVAIAVVAAIGGYFYFQDKHEQAESLTRIGPSEIILDGVRLNQSYGSYGISGRVTNKSPRYTISQLALKITFQDCTGEPPSQSCVAIGETTEHIYKQIPPQQARDFSESLYFSGGNPAGRGKLIWNYSVSEIRAD